MKMYCISDNSDTLVGYKLAGVEGIVAHTASEVEAALTAAAADNEIAVVAITEKCRQAAPDAVAEVISSHPRTLVVSIPDRHGSTGEDSMSQYIASSVGLKL